RMGDPRLRRLAEPLQDVPSDELRSLLVDMRDTMVAALGAGLAAPQIGVNLQVVIFGTGSARRRRRGSPMRKISRTLMSSPVVPAPPARP
ncbi:MAG: peptide deformylase, partial [Betaproteobacteria bacterium]